MKPGEFIEVFVRASLSVCEKRDPKGLFKKAREGIIKEFTGISAPYEEPENPEILVETDEMDLEKCVDIVLTYLRDKRVVRQDIQE